MRRHRIDQVGIDQKRRLLQHMAGDFRLVGGEPHDDCWRSLFADGERLRQGGAHQRRWIVEKHQHRAFRGGAIVGRKLGEDVGARQRAGRIGAFGGGGATEPLQELTNNHVSTDATRLLWWPALFAPARHPTTYRLKRGT